MEKVTKEQRQEIEYEIMEQGHRIACGRFGRRAVNPERENERIMRR